MDAMKQLRWSDALKYTKKNLDDCVREAKKINTAYQKYLTENPHKQKKKEYADKRAKLTERIMELIEKGPEQYDGK
jgi:gas vesicle protein